MIKPRMAWPLILFLMLLVAGLHLLSSTLSYDNFLLVGSDGPYYPIQVRSLLETGRLAFPDMPLLFSIEAVVAKVLVWLRIASLDESILLATRYTASVLSALAILPVYWIARTLNGPLAQWSGPTYLVLLFSVMNVSTFFSFPGSLLLKNSFAVVWVFSYLYFALRLIQYGERRDLYYSLAALVLCGLTHFGSLALLMLYSGLWGCFWLMQNRKSFVFQPIIGLKTVASIAFPFALIAAFDPVRFFRLVTLPLKVFEAPLILLTLDGVPFSNFVNPINFISSNALLALAIVAFISIWKKLGRMEQLFGFTSLTLAALLLSPFIGFEWASRLQMMAYIPLTMAYFIIFSIKTSPWVKLFPAALLGMIIALSIAGVFMPGGACMSNPAYTEFKEIKNEVGLGKNTLIVGRQDLRLLSSWEFGSKGMAEYLFTVEELKNYDQVYLIRQAAGSNLNENRFVQADVPPHSQNVFQGDFFELYDLRDIQAWRYGKGKPSFARGKVLDGQKGRYRIAGGPAGRIKTIEVTENTKMQLLNGNAKLEEGMQVQVWGHYRPFSLTILAETIEEY
ncbi:MAG: hypothetical protein H6573_23680 [Lewinellaceae bacterium]|nr:hypothetical protein [Phaeodactylibacter sp.]MCB0613776.1 hypothetical protein [Phaeodactylibacter sp.]MCB9350490.1 hypothetical protein [Lewinellaceae bacterium]